MIPPDRLDLADGPRDGDSRRPQPSLHDHSDRHPASTEDLAFLNRLLERALPRILDAPGVAESVLRPLEDVEISLVDDEAIAAVHGDFLDDPTPTDVITFHHGEILVSVETAAREAAARGGPALRETALYLIHGLLHLHGHTDADPELRAVMHEVQDRILDDVWPPDAPSGTL